MKRSIWILGLVAVFAFFLTTTVRAATVINDQDIPVTATFPNPCTGGTDTATGTEHAHLNLTISPDSIHLNENLHVQLDVTDSVVGSCSGQVSAAANVNFDSGGPITLSTRERVQVECPGSNNNFFVLLTDHVTVNADGTITHSVSDFDVACK